MSLAGSTQQKQRRQLPPPKATVMLQSRKAHAVARVMVKGPNSLPKATKTAALAKVVVVDGFKRGTCQRRPRVSRGSSATVPYAPSGAQLSLVSAKASSDGLSWNVLQLKRQTPW